MSEEDPTEQIQINEHQKKALTPFGAQRYKAVKTLMANTSLDKLQKLRKVQEIQTNFRAQAGKVLTPEQTKKLEALQAGPREKLLGSYRFLSPRFAVDFSGRPLRETNGEPDSIPHLIARQPAPLK